MITLVACRDHGAVIPADASVDAAPDGAIAIVCVGDDERDNGVGDDNASLATVITAPTIGNPTFIDGRICGGTIEADWFAVSFATASELAVRVTTSAKPWLTVQILDGNDTPLSPVDVSAAWSPPHTTYHVGVWQTAPRPDPTTTAYALELVVPECRHNRTFARSISDEFSCTDPARPICGFMGECGPALDACIGDDAGDTGPTPDDGPASARDVTGAIGSPVTIDAAICGAPPAEADYYKVTVAQGEGLVVNIASSFIGHIDVQVFDASGRTYARSDYVDPKTFTLTYLPAGTYYVRVTQPNTPDLNPYTITVTRTAAQTCASAADCAAEYSTQLYRGNCTAGACSFIDRAATARGALGTACDSSDDCASQRCSYREFEANAQRSVCTEPCMSSATCASDLGAGFACTNLGSNFTNYCMPGCATDLDCGTDLNNSELTTGQPWHYLSCTASSGVCEGPLVCNSWSCE